MLVLVRRIGETILIGDDIRIVVVGVSRNQVRLGIEAPKEIPVHRSEIYERIQNEERLDCDVEISDAIYNNDEDPYYET